MSQASVLPLSSESTKEIFAMTLKTLIYLLSNKAMVAF
jgi:hypothetical protein